MSLRSNNPGLPAFVLVHGAWHGGWCWRIVADRLRRLGHRVITPTCTGLGDRAHLMSSTITLDTFTQDVMAAIEMEELQDIVLVGHSFGGLPASGVADRMPERIRALLFLDSLLIQPGQCAFDALTPETQAARHAAAAPGGGLSLPVPSATALGVTGPEAAWLARRLTPHPLSTFTSPLRLQSPVGHHIPVTYIACTDPPYPPLDGVRHWARAQSGWAWRELAASHDAMVTHPERLTDLLLELSQSVKAAS